MSELRDECYKCLNNQNCIPAADYGSFYCMTRRKFKMPEHEEDSVYATKFAAMKKQIDDKDKRIKELENKLHEINEYILINGIDEPLKTATQIKVENQQQYIIQEKFNFLEKKLENSIPKQKVKETLDDIYDFFERLNVPDEDIEYIESKKEELLEEGE